MGCDCPWRAGRVDFGEAADLAGDGEQVVGGVDGLLGGVELVEHGTDQGRLADLPARRGMKFNSESVIRDADAAEHAEHGDARECSHREQELSRPFPS